MKRVSFLLRFLQIFLQKFKFFFFCFRVFFSLKKTKIGILESIFEEKDIAVLIVFICYLVCPLYLFFVALSTNMSLTTTRWV